MAELRGTTLVVRPSDGGQGVVAAILCGESGVEHDDDAEMLMLPAPRGIGWLCPCWEQGACLYIL